MKTSHILATTVAALLGFTSSLHAGRRYWIDLGGGSFTDSGNWSTVSGGAVGGGVPTSSDYAQFDNGGTYSTSRSS